MNADIQKVDKANLQPEHTHPGPVHSPPVDIFESAERISLLADMPGVKAQDLKIDLRDGVLTLSGRVTALGAADNQASVLREFVPGTFFRQFTVSETIDQAKIDAKLADGVLRLDLPKLERARPRQINVKSS
jgi:HSP20 family molecular chaperone IbpA